MFSFPFFAGKSTALAAFGGFSHLNFNPGSHFNFMPEILLLPRQTYLDQTCQTRPNIFTTLEPQPWSIHVSKLLKSRGFRGLRNAQSVISSPGPLLIRNPVRSARSAADKRSSPIIVAAIKRGFNSHYSSLKLHQGSTAKTAARNGELQL